MLVINSLQRMGVQNQDDLNLRILNIPKEITNKILTEILLEHWRDSDEIKDMISANKYYAVRNISISGKKRQYKDEKGTTYQNEGLSNVKIPMADYRTSVENKVNYAFGKPFIISVNNISADDGENKDKEEVANKYIKEWQNFSDMYFIRELKRIGKNAINNGIGWAFITISNAGKLVIKSVKSETIYPKWLDESHDNLVYLVRDYADTVIINDAIEEVQRIEYWDNDTVEYFIDDGGDLITDVEMEQIKGGNFHLGTQSWGKIPFVPLKGTDDELPLLNLVRDLVDAMDGLNSKSIDTLFDDINPLLVLKNYSAYIGALKEARDMAKNMGIMSVDENGGAEYLKVDANITAIQQKLEYLQKIFVRNSYDVNYEDVRFGGNPNQLVLKSIFQKLDTYVDGLEIEFQVFINNLKCFFDRWLEFKGIGTVELWSNYQINVKLNRDMLVNADNDIKNLLELAKLNPDYMISIESLDGYNPMLENHEAEQARREAESESKHQTELENHDNDMVGFINATRSENAVSPVDEQDIENQVEQTSGKSLNGAQTQSLVSIIQQYQSNALTLGQAINIISVSIGISKEEAKKIIEGLN